MSDAPENLHSAERLVFFTDAVVAIAMTLLILPLLESVAQAAHDGLGTAGYLQAYDGQLFAFGLSFVIISIFWRSHDRLFGPVRKQDAVLQWLNVAWLFTIVWLPVVTALMGAMETDTLQIVLYIGTMLVTSLIELAMLLWLRRRPVLVDPGHVYDRAGLSSLVIVSSLFALALVLSVIVPSLHYWGLLVLLLNAVFARIRQHSRNS